MAQPYVGEIRLFAGNFAPAGWAICDGTLQIISENETLFQLIGTTYGGDGQSTFGLPDLRGRIPIHQGAGPGLSARTLADSGGSETVTLLPAQIPAHAHAVLASTNTGTSSSPEANVLSQSPSVTMYRVGAATQSLAPAAVVSVGGSQPHENRQPYLGLSYIISLFGIFPTPS